MDNLFSENSTSIADRFDAEANVAVIESDVSEALSLLPGVFSLIVTSPPYNIGKEYEKQVGLEKYLTDQAAIIKQLVTVLNPGGSLCWQELL